VGAWFLIYSRLHLCAADFVALCGGCPLIIGADLNSLPDSEVYDRLLSPAACVVGCPEVIICFAMLYWLTQHVQGVELWNVSYDSNFSGGRALSSPPTEEWLSRLQANLHLEDGEESGGNSDATSGLFRLSFSSAYAESSRMHLMSAAVSSSSCSPQTSVTAEPAASIAAAEAAAAPSANFEPEFTNFTESFKGCIDYLLFSNHPCLTLVDVHPLLTKGHMSDAQCVGIPSLKPAEPSDHLPLAATFNLRV
jgi:hypothetical protein